MCLEIIAQIPKDAKNWVGAKRLSKLSGLHVSKVTYEKEPALHFSVNGGCSCDFLDDNADWNSPVWLLLKDELPSLEKAIAAIGKESKNFRFLAHWLDGKAPMETLKANLKGLLKDIRSNQIRNNVMYLIGFGR